MAIFSKIPGNRVKRSMFDLGHERKFSGNMGELIPILCEEVVPGDTFKCNTEVLTRLAPMVAPVMHRVNVYTHFFFVPNRLVWSEWENFITGGEDGQSLPVVPYIRKDGSSSVFNKGNLADYLGLPIGNGSATPINVNAMPFRAYQTIYNEYYRDQNLQTKLVVEKTSGQVSDTEAGVISVLRKRAWEKDYFTSALPWTQRGGDVQLPLTGNADIVFTPGTTVLRKPDGTVWGGADSVINVQSDGKIETTDETKLNVDNSTNLEADLSSVSAATIEELRRATKLQKWLERNARSGSRYIEQMLAHFGVKSSDARLQRPEYLGGGKSPIVISEVLQTSSTDATSPQGEMAGHGVGVGNSHAFKKYFEEHGYVIGLVSVLPRTAYIQGIRKHFLKTDKFDYFWPEFAQLGEQPVLQGELYSVFEPVADAVTFGYQSRYAEYKFIPSSVHGDMRDNLDFWHMGRKFATSPSLNGTFVTADPTHRIFAVTDPSIDKLYFQVYNNLKAVRPLPYFNVPTL